MVISLSGSVKRHCLALSCQQSKLRGLAGPPFTVSVGNGYLQQRKLLSASRPGVDDASAHLIVKVQKTTLLSRVTA